MQYIRTYGVSRMHKLVNEVDELIESCQNELLTLSKGSSLQVSVNVLIVKQVP